MNAYERKAYMRGVERVASYIDAQAEALRARGVPTLEGLPARVRAEMHAAMLSYLAHLASDIRRLKLSDIVSGTYARPPV